MSNMADLNRNMTRILIALCAVLILLGLVGHFLMDISGSAQPDSFVLHAGLMLLSLIVIVGLLALVFILIGVALIFPPLFRSPLIRPPAALR
jgi:TRAP-type C4-dicarboxylate transport system permease small subunit